MQNFTKIKEILEFDKIVEFIAQKCVSETGKARLINSEPLTQKEILQTLLDQIQEMRELYQFEGGLPIWHFVDVRVLLSKIEPVDSYLSVQDFLALQNILELVQEIASFTKKITGKYPVLSRVLQAVQPLPKLLNQIKFTFEPSGRLFDNASPQLKIIRKDMERVNTELHTRLERILRKQAEHVQEEYLTLRDGRLVIPVREFSLNKVPGIVHGQSGTGATYFVEPMQVVELNNDMQKLISEEQKEIIRILKRLSAAVREEQAVLLTDFELLNQLDVLQAKARYANEVKGLAPQISEDFVWQIKAARHPVLLKMHAEKTVPLSLEIGGEEHILIISGPNAGGKTVALKTVGLLQLLFQSGFHIPVAAGTRMPVCENIFCVIGDEQSIEQDLSTFSSHVKSLNDIVNHVAEHNLVLIDEIGSGTEPGSGAALAIAILEKLNRPDMVTIATTHQNQLKAFAAETAGIQNAAMQFDSDKLTPLFTLEMGVPGSSYTFEICRRLGLDEGILDRAVELSRKETFELDALLADLTRKSQQYRQMVDEMSIQESKLKSLTKLYDDKTRELKKKAKQYEREAKEKARTIIDEANREIEATIRAIREAQAEKQVVKKVRAQLQARRTALAVQEESETPKQVPDISRLKTGQRVRSLKFGIKGQISKVLKKRNSVEIDRNGIKITVPVDDVEVLETTGSTVKTKRSVTTGIAPTVNIPNELDIRGLTVDEALRQVEAYLDKALMSSWEEVRLVHGKGTGALRKAIQDYLAGLPAVKEFRSGKWGEGDLGVTVVKLG